MHPGLKKAKCCVRYTDLGQVLPPLVVAAAVHPVGTVVLVGIDLVAVVVHSVGKDSAGCCPAVVDHPVGTAVLVGIDLAVVVVLDHPVPADLDLAVDTDPDLDLVVVVLHVFDLYRPREVVRHYKTIVVER